MKNRVQSANQLMIIQIKDGVLKIPIYMHPISVVSCHLPTYSPCCTWCFVILSIDKLVFTTSKNATSSFLYYAKLVSIV